MPTPEEIIEANLADGIKKVQIGNQAVEQHSIADQIAAAEFLANQQAASRTRQPIRVGRFTPGGAV